MELPFSGQYDRAAYFKAIQWVYKPSRRSSIIRIVAFVLFLILYVAYIVSALREEGVSSPEFSRLARYSITFLILGYFIFQPYINAYRSATRLWADPMVRRKIGGQVSSLGVQFAPSDKWMPWDGFIKVHKSDDLVVLVTAKWDFVALQRKFFQSDAEWKMLQDMVASRVKEVIE
ncbi:MAG: hypothetical protein ACOYYS_15535 [Chloroflexota bacterium]